MKITRNANRIVMLAAIVFMAIGGVMTRGEEVADGVPVEDEEVADAAAVVTAILIFVAVDEFHRLVFWRT